MIMEGDEDEEDTLGGSQHPLRTYVYVGTGHEWWVLANAAGQVGGARLERRTYGNIKAVKIRSRGRGRATGIEPETAIQEIGSVTKHPQKPIFINAGRATLKA